MANITVRSLSSPELSSPPSENWWSSDPVADAPSVPRLDSRSRDLVIRTIFGEASAEPDEGKAAVAAVIRNRLNAGRFGKTAADVVLARNQFEPWSRPDAKRRMENLPIESPVYKKIGDIVDRTFSTDEDPTNGSTHFFAPQAQAALGRDVPSWAKGEGIVIGRHTFFAPEGRVLKASAEKPTTPATAAPAEKPFWQNDPFADVKPAAPTKPELPKVSQGDALSVGALQGLTFNFGDELAGVTAASGVSPFQKALNRANPMTGLPSEAIVGLARLGYEYFTGQPGPAMQAYEQERDRIRTQHDAAKQQHPWTTTGGEVMGAVALPVGGLLNAATLPARIGRGAAVGATAGALYGAGEGQDLPDRASRAATGAVLGGTVGAVASPVVEGVIQGTRAAVSPIVTGVRGAMNPEQEAARRVATAVQRDVQVDPNALNRLTPQEFLSTPEATIMDLGGETTRALARSAANTSPEGRALLNRTIDDRFETQSDRVTNWFNTRFNYPNALTQREAIERSAQAVNRPAYARAYADGNRIALWNDELQRLAQAPEIQAAIRIATPQMKNWAVRDGFQVPKGAFDIVDGKTVLRTTENGNTIMPSLQYWDYVKRALDMQNTPTSRAFAQALRAELDALVPSYATARAGAARFFGAENALEAGQNFVLQNFNNQEVARQLARMTPAERWLFQDGFVSRYIEMLNRTGDRRNVLNQIADNPQAREKLNMVLGPQRANELEALFRVEGIMDLSRGAVQANSTTARQLAELGFAGGAGSLGISGVYNMDPQQMTYAAVAGALLAGKRGIDQRVANRVAQLLVSNDPQLFLRGVQIVSRNNRMMENLRSADRAIARVGAEETPKTGLVVQSPSTARTDEQPKIPGPVPQ